MKTEKIQDQKQPDQSAQEHSNPRLKLAYQITPSGGLYKGQKSERKYLGIQIVFDVIFSVPKYQDQLEIQFAVESPSSFKIESSYISYLSPSFNEGKIGDDLVYRIMAARAFDQFSQKSQKLLSSLFDKSVHKADSSSEQ